MERDQLEHVLRASAAITREREFVVVGSQAILAQHPDAPAALKASREVDLYPRHAPDLADLIDGSIGEGSPFEATFGYYAQGVGPETAVLPDGWQDRLVRVESPGTGGAVGLCLEKHDLAVAKYVAGREKDRVFLRVLTAAGLVDRSSLLERAALLPDPATASRVRAAIERDFGPAAP